MPVNDNLGTRMKEYYENIPKTKLMRRTPVVIRIDGKAFHTFTHGFEKPFDKILMKSMQETMKYLCENIQGCVFGYCQSDEITLILIDYQKLNSSAWFDYKVQKMCGVTASMATMKFNKIFEFLTKDYGSDFAYAYGVEGIYNEKKRKQWSNYRRAVTQGATFDCRCFNIPKEEVTNLIYWRQLDATRNSIQMVGQANFSHNELQDKSCSNIQDMLMEQKGINWNDFPTACKRGAACIKGENGWMVDTEMPILKGENRKYIDDLIYVNE